METLTVEYWRRRSSRTNFIYRSHEDKTSLITGNAVLESQKKKRREKNPSRDAVSPHL